MSTEFNPDVTIRGLLEATWTLARSGKTKAGNKRESRFENAERDCIIKSISVKKIVVYSKKGIPVYSLEVSSTSEPKYKEYLDKGRRTKKVLHTYPVKFSFYFPGAKGDQPLTLDTPVKIRTGKGGKWPKITPKMKKSIRSEKNPRGKYLSVNDLIAQEYGINGDFYWRISAIRSKLGFLFGVNYAPDPSGPDKDGFFLTKHEIAVIYQLGKLGYFVMDSDTDMINPGRN